MDTISFLELFRRYINYHRNTKNYWEKKNPNTLRHWNAKYTLIENYLIDLGQESLPAINVDTAFAQKLFSHLLEFQSHNHAARGVAICSAVLNFGGREGLISMNKLQFYKIKRQPPKRPPPITPEQIENLKNYVSFSIERTKAAAMMYVQLMTSYDYGDLAELKPESVREIGGIRYIIKNRHKNGQECMADIDDHLYSILVKYNFRMQLLPNQRYNIKLREVASECGITAHVTSKSLRKMFFMNQVNNLQRPVEVVSKMGGHKKISTTQEYYLDLTVQYVHSQLKNHIKKNSQ